jgi:Ulp1 family protease
MEWNARAKGSIRQLPFVDRSCRCIPLETPYQRNEKDSGIFVLHNCESFFDTVGSFDWYAKPSPGANWYPSLDIQQKRIIIRELIGKKFGLDLYKELPKMSKA